MNGLRHLGSSYHCHARSPAGISFSSRKGPQSVAQINSTWVDWCRVCRVCRVYLAPPHARRGWHGRNVGAGAERLLLLAACSAVVSSALLALGRFEPPKTLNPTPHTPHPKP